MVECLFSVPSFVVHGARVRALLSCPMAGCGTSATIVATDQYFPAALVADDRNAYWVTAFGDIVECPLSGCGKSPLVLAKAQLGAGGAGLAIDDQHLYWDRVSYAPHRIDDIVGIEK